MNPILLCTIHAPLASPDFVLDVPPDCEDACTGERSFPPESASQEDRLRAAFCLLFFVSCTTHVRPSVPAPHFFSLLCVVVPLVSLFDWGRTHAFVEGEGECSPLCQ